MKLAECKKYKFDSTPTYDSDGMGDFEWIPDPQPDEWSDEPDTFESLNSLTTRGDAC